MPKRADIILNQSASNAQLNAGAATQYLIQTPTGVLYWVYCDTGADVAFKKSTDGGLTWNAPTIIFAGTIFQISVWYDRWSNISAGLIHCAYTETGGNDTLYRTVDTESSDALSTQTTIFNGASAAISGSFISICRARGGNVYCRTQIDAGVEGGFFRLPNANVPNGAWDAARTINEASATLDMMILLPGWAADNQDMMAIFWDASANEVSRQLYDDSANTWAETSIATSMADTGAGNSFPNFSALVDITNSRNVLIAWNGVDTANADLLCWVVTESAITAKTDVVTNGTDDQAMCGITIDLQTGYWWAFYGGKSDGSETYTTSMNIYYKVSKDGGTTWGSETQATLAANGFVGLYVVPRIYIGPPPVVQYLSAQNTMVLYRINAEINFKKGMYQIGL